MTKCKFKVNDVVMVKDCLFAIAVNYVGKIGVVKWVYDDCQQLYVKLFINKCIIIYYDELIYIGRL